MTSKAERNSPLQLWNVTNVEYEEKPYPSIKLRCPGLSPGSFDRDGNPSLTSIMMMSAQAKFAALQQPVWVTKNSNSDSVHGTGRPDGKTFLDLTEIISEYYIFMSSVEFVMSRAMYNNGVPKWPLDMKFTQGFVGNTSAANVCQVFACNEEDQTNASESGQAALCTKRYQVILVDKTTRKPTQLPDWLKKAYKGKGCMDKGFILKRFTRPSITFCHSSQVQWTDIDKFKHANFTTYARWAIDALHAALLQESKSWSRSNNSSVCLQSVCSVTQIGSDDMRVVTPNGSGDDECGGRLRPVTHTALRGITKETVANGVRRVHINYLKECLEGECVQTHVWQEEGGEKELVLFSVVKDGEDICQMKMWYFPADEDSAKSFSENEGTSPMITSW